MRDHFAEVLDLQERFSSENTLAMAARGNLIRNIIPAELRTWSATKQGAAAPFNGRLNVQGRDGTGRKTLVPWVRVHSPELSPSAQNGWYVVYLFKEDGSGVTLGLSHGSTRFDGKAFVPRTPQEAAKLMTWSRGLLQNAGLVSHLDVGVDLGSFGDLAIAYQRTTAFSRTYDRANLPSDSELEADLASFMRLLGLVYQEEQFGAEYPSATVKPSSLVRDSEPAGQSQGFGLSALERALVEARAMTLAFEWLQNSGFTDIVDVHLIESCDFKAKRGDLDYVVEVKGSTCADIDQILLTKNEVALHLKESPQNVLITVSGIMLDTVNGQAHGGLASGLVGWLINPDLLRATQYTYQLADDQVG